MKPLSFISGKNFYEFSVSAPFRIIGNLIQSTGKPVGEHTVRNGVATYLPTNKAGQTKTGGGGGGDKPSYPPYREPGIFWCVGGGPSSSSWYSIKPSVWRRISWYSIKGIPCGSVWG